MAGVQQQRTTGAWDQDLVNDGPRTVTRFGPESRHYDATMADLHVDGDVGIGDLVFASTYWKLPLRQQNEYSQYMENYQGGVREALTCTNDPTYGTGPYENCAVPAQY